MALNVQFFKVHNHLTDEDIVVPRIVNQQSLDFNALCEYLADGSTVTAADVAAVMKQIETRLPLVLGLNAKVVCSPEGLTFRPKVSGSITQSQLKAKLQAKLLADPTADIDVNRPLTTSDLSISDLTAEIAIELPKKWNDRFHTKATFKRINKVNAESSESTENTQNSGGSTETPGGGDEPVPGGDTGGDEPIPGGNTGGDEPIPGGGS